jgi:hypothetical protein
LFYTFICPALAIDPPQLLYTGDKVSKSTEEILLSGANLICDFYQDINFAIDITNIKIRVFDSFENYKKYQKSNSNIKSDNGYYSKSNKEIVLFKNNNLVKTFFHEFNHYLMRSRISNPPKWINEGLSEYFEESHLTSEGTISRHPQYGKIKRIKSWLQGDIDKDLRWVISCSNEQWSAQSFEPDYKSSTLSYAIIFFIMSQENGKEVIGKILQNISNGKVSMEAINLSYPGGFDKFELDFVRLYRDYSL